MHNSSLLLLLVFCVGLTLLAVTFQQTAALRRIKRGSTATKNKTKLSNDILLDKHNISGGDALTTLDGHQEVKGHTEHAWAKKAVAAVEYAIDKAFASLGHKSVEEKAKKGIPPSAAPLVHANSGALKLEETSSASKNFNSPSLTYMLNNGGYGERFLDGMQHANPFGEGNGVAEMLIIDNDLRPMLNMPFAFHPSNLRGIANGFKRLSEDARLNQPNVLKTNTDHSTDNTVSRNIVGKQTTDNGINEENANKEVAVTKDNKRNNNHNNIGSKSENVAGDNRNRNYVHVTVNGEDNSQAKSDAMPIGEKSQHTKSLQQLHQPEVRNLLPTLLSHSYKSLNSKGEPIELHAETVEQNTNQQKKSQSNLLQQQVQVVKHSNGKTLPMESFLKFANMMMYNARPDGAPIHAQGAQLSVSGSPTTSVISISPGAEGGEDTEAIDLIFNTLDPQLNHPHNSGSLGAAPFFASPSSSGLLSRPFIMPPFSLAGPAQPINFIENALDMLLNGEDEANDEVELVCPIHHPKKKSNENTAEGKDNDAVIQVCSCRLFKKNKNA